MSNGSWALAEELFARGDAAFVAELRKVHDAERLGQFAARWLADARPVARKMLLEYLSLPLNAYRHEALVKRLFKAAEKASDDEVMGAFLVAFDRSLRHQRRTRTRTKWDNSTSRAEAEAKTREWEREGYLAGPVGEYAGRFFVSASKREEVVVLPGNTKMPRPVERELKKNQHLVDYVRQRLERRYILFSVPTRRYLRRRAWRYFRRVAKVNLARYRDAATAYLKRYVDADVDSDIHLLDNWGLIHTLFGESPVLVRPARGWELAPGTTLDQLAPAPRFPEAWARGPEWLLDLLTNGNCRTVRYWAAVLLRREHMDWLLQRPIDAVLALIDHPAAEVAALGFDVLERRPDLASVPVGKWLARLGGDDLEKLERLSKLLSQHLDPARLALVDIVQLTMHRSLPVARLGLTLLRGRKPDAQPDVDLLLLLVQAECATIRPELAAWLRGTLEQAGPPRREWLLEFLDSKHADMRAVGWAWLNESALKDDATIWQRLMESPYDDVKMPLVAQLTKRLQDAEGDTVLLLWASVLLNIHRGGRHKPGVVAQLVERMNQHPAEAERLMPLLAIAVRSLRGPEFRAGLSGVVTLHERRPGLRPAIARQFPELKVKLPITEEGGPA